MNEKRFSETERNCYYTSLVFDNQTQKELGTTKVVDLLNEQQLVISKLDEDNTYYIIENLTLKKENKQLKSRVDYLENMYLDILIILTKDDKLIMKK